MGVFRLYGAVGSFAEVRPLLCGRKRPRSRWTDGGRGWSPQMLPVPHTPHCAHLLLLPDACALPSPIVASSRWSWSFVGVEMRLGCCGRGLIVVRENLPLCLELTDLPKKYPLTHSSSSTTIGAGSGCGSRNRRGSRRSPVPWYIVRVRACLVGWLAGSWWDEPG